MLSLYFKLLCGTFKVLGGSFSISLPSSHSTITSIPLTQILQCWSHYGEKWGEMLESAAFLSHKHCSTGPLWKKRLGRDRIKFTFMV